MKAAIKEQITPIFSENLINLEVESWVLRGVIRPKSVCESLYVHAYG